jgi:hypothetical protein
MRKMPLFLALSAAALASTPALAQPRELPSGAEIEAMAPALGRAMEGMLDVDVGPIVDAVDPYARRPGHGAPGRTLRNLGRRGDPDFDRRLRDSLYGTTAGMARMADAFAAAAPALRGAMLDFEANIRAVARDTQRRLPPPQVDDDWDREYEDGYEGDPYSD